MTLSWFFVWASWLMVTRTFHPTLGLALIVTTSLIIAYAIVVWINQCLLIPRLWQSGHRVRYGIALLIVMLLLNSVALTIIRLSYARLWGPDADPNGVYKHFAIDLFGIAVHVAGAWGILFLVARRRNASARTFEHPR